MLQILALCPKSTAANDSTKSVLRMSTPFKSTRHHSNQIFNLSSSSVGNDHKMHKYSVWCICHVRGRNFYYFEKSSRWAKFTSNSHPTIVTNTNLLNFHFPISNFLRTGGHAQKQIVKKKMRENLASHENFCFRLGKLQIFFFTTRQERKENTYVLFFIFVIVGAIV